MLTIRVESKFQVPKFCDGRNSPKIEAGYYVFDATDEEYMFWNGLEALEKDRFLSSMPGRCFFDALHELMRTKRPENYLESASLS
jgi:hypothetical protein